MFHNFPDVGEPGLGGTHSRATGHASPIPLCLHVSVPGSQGWVPALFQELGLSSVSAGFGCHGGNQNLVSYLFLHLQQCLVHSKHLGIPAPQMSE